tara:strand:+ start:200 stop:457 length:258 start_codon:yes stop_codon:yes gene_type:complete
MFYVFDSTGRIFDGTLETLRRVEKTSAIRSVRTVADPSNIENQSGGSLQRGETADYMVSSKHAKQYGDMLAQRGSREAVYHAYQK